jgi:hypothetical protein
MSFNAASKTIRWLRKGRNEMKVTAVLVIVLATWVQLWAQTKRCEVGMNAPPIGFWTWPAGTQVKVYVVETGFQPGEVSFLLAPLASWNAVSELTGSRVRFEYAGVVTSEHHCENCLTIERGVVFDKQQRHLTELHAYSARGDSTLSWASIVVDRALTNPKAITDAITHELGHNFGLRDCYSCKAKATVMNQFGRVNLANEMPAPTTCDITQVKAAYERLRAPVLAKKIAEDEGEEPVDDDPPIVVPKP